MRPEPEQAKLKEGGSFAFRISPDFRKISELKGNNFNRNIEAD
jgi:hypothetical protein